MTSLCKWHLSFLLFLTACQPVDINFTNLSTSQAGEFLKNPDDPYYLRQGQKEFPDRFLSDKLDLVFVLDTSPSMKSFYQTNPFGPDFLNRFQKYDWKFAYTDMSVDTQFIKQSTQEEKDSDKKTEKKSCGFLQSLIVTTLGVAFDKTITLGWGLRGLVNCVSSLDFKINFGGKKTFANGGFLPLEHNGNKMELNQLTQSIENHNSIFDHSLRLGNEKKGWLSYEAPEQRKTDPYPFLAMILSIAQGYSTSPGDSQNQQTSSFFRKDSSIVYVLFTTQDMKVEIPLEMLKQELKPFLGSDKRIKLIPITWEPKSSPFCSLNHPKASGDSSKLRSLAKQLGHESLNICSSDLADQLFNEISKSLYPSTGLSSL